MVNIADFFRFENPETLAVAIGVLIFVVSYFVLIRFFKAKGMTLLISFIIALIVTWNLYKERFYEWETGLAIVLVIIVVVILFRIVRGFVRGRRY